MQNYKTAILCTIALFYSCRDTGNGPVEIENKNFCNYINSITSSKENIDELCKDVALNIWSKRYGEDSIVIFYHPLFAYVIELKEGKYIQYSPNNNINQIFCNDSYYLSYIEEEGINISEIDLLLNIINTFSNLSKEEIFQLYILFTIQPLKYDKIQNTYGSIYSGTSFFLDLKDIFFIENKEDILELKNKLNYNRPINLSNNDIINDYKMNFKNIPNNIDSIRETAIQKYSDYLEHEIYCSSYSPYGKIQKEYIKNTLDSVDNNSLLLSERWDYFYTYPIVELYGIKIDTTFNRQIYIKIKPFITCSGSR